MGVLSVDGFNNNLDGFSNCISGITSGGSGLTDDVGGFSDGFLMELLVVWVRWAKCKMSVGVSLVFPVDWDGGSSGGGVVAAVVVAVHLAHSIIG